MSIVRRCEADSSGGHAQEKSIARIEDTFKIMANHEFFHGVWSNKDLATGAFIAMGSVVHR